MNKITHSLKLALAIMLIVLLFSMQPPSATHAASFTVDSTLDTNDATPGDGICDDGNGNCTLRAAISETNALAGNDTITLPADTYTLSIAGTGENLNATGDLDITDTSGTLIINGASGGSTINGATIDRVLDIANNVSVEINNLTITNGGRGGISNYNGTLTLNNSTVSGNSSDNSGGGIYNAGGGAITLNNSTVSGNSCIYYGGGIFNSEGSITLDNSTVSGNSAASGGGGIYNSGGSITLNNSTVSGNSAASGGGICNSEGSATLNNSTVSDNSAAGSGGGIYNNVDFEPATLNLNHSTITNNIADSDSNGIGDGGGIYNFADEESATVNFTNSTVSGNSNRSTPANDDCSTDNGTQNSLGYNIIGNNDGCSVVSGTGDNFGTTGSPVDALLAPLALNGGPKTHALLSSSPALDKIPYGTNGCGTTYTADQRGKTRPVNSFCDIGAFELQSTEIADQDCSNPFNPTGVNVSATLNGGSNDPGCFSALKRSVFPGLAQTSGEFGIVWVLSTDNASFDMNLRLCYTATELTASGIADESTITAYRWDETTGAWAAQTTTPDAANNCVDVANVTQFSPWTLAGDGNAPTAVSLQSISATSNAAILPALIAIFMLALMGGFVALRRRA